MFRRAGVAACLLMWWLLQACGVPGVSLVAPAPTHDYATETVSVFRARSIARLTAVAASEPCIKTASTWAAQSRALFSEFNDANQVASRTSRIALPAQVQRLQDIRRRAEALQVPPCAQHAQDLLVQGIAATTDAYLAFMGEESGVSAKVQHAIDVLKEYQVELARLNQPTAN
jgi:hypothetical protein